MLRTRAGFDAAAMFQSALDPLSLSSIPASSPAVNNMVKTNSNLKKFSSESYHLKTH
jgi:hypothetical protein